MKKVCVVTGTRAEYGLLRLVIEGIKNSSGLELKLVVTGMHLSPEFGLTYREIEEDGFHIDRKVEMLMSSDTACGVTKSIGLGVIGFADALHELKPDLLLILGDRYEIFAVATAALIAGIPIAHLHGGETTEGAFDEALRHSITKMSHLHFVAAEEYFNRVVQLGEDPDRVFIVGGLGVDSILNLELMDRDALESSLNFKLGEKNLLITYHPVTFEKSTAEEQMRALLGALEKRKETRLIFTLPNADTDGRVISRLIEDFVSRNANAAAFTSLGQRRYLSCLQYVDGVIGNSSSGLIEAPTFQKGTVNIGDRQRGRLKAASVIDCSPTETSIQNAIDKLYSRDFQEKLAMVENPYGQGGASKKIIEVIETVSLSGVLKKRFYDIHPTHYP